MYFYRARNYDSAQGRFIQKDPFGFNSMELNLYVYVNDSPVNNIDPLGLFCIPAGGVSQTRDISSRNILRRTITGGTHTPEILCNDAIWLEVTREKTYTPQSLCCEFMPPSCNADAKLFRCYLRFDDPIKSIETELIWVRTKIYRGKQFADSGKALCVPPK